MPRRLLDDAVVQWRLLGAASGRRRKWRGGRRQLDSGRRRLAVQHVTDEPLLVRQHARTAPSRAVAAAGHRLGIDESIDVQVRRQNGRRSVRGPLNQPGNLFDQTRRGI